MPTNTTPDYSAWLTKEQAAEAIGVATKTIEQYAKNGKLQTAKYRRPTGGPKISVYHPEDVATLRKELNPTAPAFVVPKAKPAAAPAKTQQSTALVRANKAPAPADFMQLLESLTSRRTAGVRVTEKVFLTIPEAAAFSGLPQAEILRRLKSKGDNALYKGAGAAYILPAMKTGAGWRVRRKDLEKL